MLLTIHNLPFRYGYTEVKELLKEKCGLHDILLDNFVVEGSTRKVTVGVAEEGDAAIIVRKVNGLYVENHQLYVEDGRRKKELDQPFRGSLPAYPQQRYQVPKQQQQFNPPGGPPQRFPNQGFNNNQRFQAKPNDTNQGFANQLYQIEQPIQNNVGFNGPLLQASYVMPTPVLQPNPYVGNMYYNMQQMQDQNFMGYPSKNSPITYPTHEAQTQNNQNYQNPQFDSTWDDGRPSQVEEIGFRRSPEQWRPKSRSPRPERQRKEYPRQEAWNNVENSVREFKERCRSPKSWDERSSRKRRNDSRYERDSHKSFEKRPANPSFDEEGRRGFEKGSLLGRPALQEPHFNERPSREKRPRMEERRHYRDVPHERSEASRPDHRPKDQGLGYPEDMDRPRPPKPELTPEQLRVKRENVDDTTRGQAAARISHEILQQFDKSASAPAIKALRQLVRQQINVVVGIELQSSIDDVVAAYRRKHAQPHDYRMYTRAMRNTRTAFREKINERRAAFKGEEPEILTKKPYVADNPAKFKKPVLLNDLAPNTSQFKWSGDQAGESGHFGNKTYYPKSVQAKPTTKTLPPRDVLSEFKKAKKVEDEAEVKLELEPALEAVLDDEVETIKKIILNSCDNPDDDIEGTICDHIKKGGSLFEILSIIKKSVRKRVLNVKNDLIVRVFYNKRPNMNDLKEFLAPYGVYSIKKAKRKSTDYYVAALDSYQTFDKFCKIDALKMGEITIKIKPFHLCGQPPKLTVAQYQKHKRMVINNQIDIKNFGDFDEERDELNQGFVEMPDYDHPVVPKKEEVKEENDRGENGAPTKKEKILSEEDIEDLLNVNEEDLEDY